MVDVLDPEVDGTGADRFAEPVIGVVVVVREDALPAFDQARRHRLGADVHQPPLVEVIVFEFYFAAVDRVKDVLRPRYQQPYDRAALLRNGADDPLRLGPAQQYRAAADEEAAEPVHFCSGMVQRRDAEKGVVPGLPVMFLLDAARVHQAPVAVHDRLRKSRRAGGKVDRRLIVVAERDRGRLGRAVRNERSVRLGETGTILADVEQTFDLRHASADAFDPPGEGGTEDQYFDVRQIHAIPDLLGGVAEVQRHRHRTALEDAEVDRQPLQAVHQQYADFRSAPDAPRQQKVRHPVGLGVELAPGDLRTEGIGRAGLDERVLLPGQMTVFQFLRIDLHQCHTVSVQPGVLFQYFGDRHDLLHTLLFCNFHLL